MTRSRATNLTHSIFNQGRAQTHVRDLAECFFREVFIYSRDLRIEGAGNAGRPMRPIAACAMVVVERTRVSQVTPESPGIPHAMVYGLYRALPGARALWPPSSAKVAFRELDTSVGVSGPRDFAVRVECPRQKHRPRPPHPTPRFVTTAIRPSSGTGRPISTTDLGGLQA